MSEPFRFSNGQLAHTGDDLLQFCQQFPQDSISYLVGGDFEKWLDYLGEKTLAEKARAARQANLSDLDRLEKFLQSDKISKSSHQNTAVAAGSRQAKLNPLTEIFQGFKNLFSRR